MSFTPITLRQLQEQAMAQLLAKIEEVRQLGLGQSDQIRYCLPAIDNARRFGVRWADLGPVLARAKIVPNEKIVAQIVNTVRSRKSRVTAMFPSLNPAPVSVPEVPQVVQADTSTRPIAPVAEPPSAAKKEVPSFLQPKPTATDTTDVDEIRAITDKHKR